MGSNEIENSCKEGHDYKHEPVGHDLGYADEVWANLQKEILKNKNERFTRWIDEFRVIIAIFWLVDHTVFQWVVELYPRS